MYMRDFKLQEKVESQHCRALSDWSVVDDIAISASSNHAPFDAHRYIMGDCCCSNCRESASHYFKGGFNENRRNPLDPPQLVSSIPPNNAKQVCPHSGVFTCIRIILYWSPTAPRLYSLVASPANLPITGVMDTSSPDTLP